MFAAMHFAQIAGIAVLVVLVLGIPFWAGFISGQAWERRKEETDLTAACAAADER